MGFPEPSSGGSLAAGSDITTPLEGQNLLIYGHSYSATNGNQASNNFGYAQRIARRCNLGTVFNRAVSATTSYSEAMVQPVADFSSFMRSATFMIWADSVVNDANDSENPAYGGASGVPAAKALAKFYNMKMFLLACIRRSGNVIANTSGTKTGTWTDNTGDAGSINFANGAAGTSSSTTTQNDSIQFTGLTAGQKYAVILQAIDDSGFGTAGASYSVVSGGTSVTGTTSNQFLAGRDTGKTRAPLVVLITVPVGQTTITVTKTDATGSVLYVNQLLPQYAIGGSIWTILHKGPYVNAVANVTMDAFNALLAAAVAAHGNGGEVLLIDANAAGWNKATMLRLDGLHPDDRGHGFLADNVYTSAREANYGYIRNTTGVA